MTNNQNRPSSGGYWFAIILVAIFGSVGLAVDIVLWTLAIGAVLVVLAAIIGVIRVRLNHTR